MYLVLSLLLDQHLPVLGLLSLAAVPLGLLRPPFVDRLQLDVGQDEPLEELWGPIQ